METSVRHAGGLSINTDIVRGLLAGFLRDGIRNAGFSHAVIGLSGGVDSAVSAALSVDALGADNVLGVLLPYRTSSQDSREHAAVLAASLSIRTEVVDITPMVDAYLERFSIHDQIRRGNVMARQRMVVLYDISARERALVIGTSNKTEIFLGYGTLFGDLASALNPLGDLYKTQVWQLAHALGIPGEIIGKKPSADLREGQTDEEDFGFTYEQVDKLLYAMVDQRRTDDELRLSGFSADFINRVKTLLRQNQFKRRPPVIAKISHRTVNVDFRYARDWGI